MEYRGRKVPCHRVDVGECPEGHHLMCRSYRRGFTVSVQLDKHHSDCFDAGVEEGRRLGLAGLLKEDGDLGEWMVNTCARDTSPRSQECFCDYHKKQAIQQLSRNLLRVETVVQWMKEILSHRLAHDSLSNRAGAPCKVASTFRTSSSEPTTLPPKKRRPPPPPKSTVEKRKRADDTVVAAGKPVAKKSKPPPPPPPPVSEPPSTHSADDNAVDEFPASEEESVELDVEVSSQVIDASVFNSQSPPTFPAAAQTADT